ncbi:hypothetical protein [Petrachloros mirabilis]
MLKWMIVTTSAVLSGSLFLSSGVSMAQQFACNPNCAPAYNNQHLGQGLTNKLDINTTDEHGLYGRSNAQLKQASSVPGYVPPPPTQPPAPGPTLSTTTTTTTDPTLSSTPTLDPTFSSTCSLC